jgi:hypothetical protein
LVDGIECGLHRIERLMRLHALRASRGAGACQRTKAIAKSRTCRRTF